mmetsp:Transcript_11949/g.30234  ORF Transcript_11949/g.30234 Transcript_11949/m.30234 type:complete len:220 (-) Transcript_11949:3668-4327(-)
MIGDETVGVRVLELSEEADEEEGDDDSDDEEADDDAAVDEEAAEEIAEADDEAERTAELAAAAGRLPSEERAVLLPESVWRAVGGVLARVRAVMLPAASAALVGREPALVEVGNGPSSISLTSALLNLSMACCRACTSPCRSLGDTSGCRARYICRARQAECGEAPDKQSCANFFSTVSFTCKSARALQPATKPGQCGDSASRTKRQALMSLRALGSVC